VKLRARLALIVLATALPVVAGIAWARARFEHETLEHAMRDAVLARMEDGGRERCEARPETFQEPPPRRGGPRERELFERMLGFPPDRGPGPDRLPPPDELDGDRGPGDRPPPRWDERDPERPPGAREGPRDGPRRGFEPRRMPGALPPRIEMWAYDSSFTSRNPRAPAFPAELRGALEAGAGQALRPWAFTTADGAREVGLQLGLRMPWDEGPCTVMLARRRDQGPTSAVSGLLWSSLALCGMLLAAVLFAAAPVVARVRQLTAQVKDSAAGRYSTTVEERGKDEISELARAFNAAGAEVRSNLEALEKRERTLRTFVENTSHDVMLPLTVLQGHLSALQKRVEAGALPDKETIREALEESHYLSSLLQNLAVAAKLEGGEPLMAHHPVDLNALVERAVSRQRPIARQRSISVEFAVPESPVWIAGDVTFVEQMLSNVIHNAVRYNHDGGHVAVLLEERGEQRTEFALRVVDDGPGIPEELCDRVVERSFRTDAARTRAPDGLGLGLSIAKDVAQRHGLAMTMRRSAAGGLEIEFTGRRGAPPPPAADAPAQLPPPAGDADAAA
jgi:signal transduction histidine kinase